MCMRARSIFRTRRDRHVQSHVHDRYHVYEHTYICRCTAYIYTAGADRERIHPIRYDTYTYISDNI